MSALTGGFDALSADTLALAGTWVAVLLTLAILSRLLGENILSRLAQHLFVGVAAGYAVGLAWGQLLWPRLQLLLSDPTGHWPTALFMLLGVLLLVRGARPAWLAGDAPVSILLGVGAGLALVGVLRGVLGPQTAAAIGGSEMATDGPAWLGVASAVILTLCTLLTLAAFHFHRREGGLLGGVDRIIQVLGTVGRRLVMLALGAVLAGAWLAFFAALQGRVAFLYSAVQQLLTATGLWP